VIDDHMTLFLASLAMALLVLGAVQAWAFAWRYSRDNWRRWAEGRHLMHFTVCLAWLLTATTLLQIIPVPLWLAAALSVVLFGWLDYELYRRHRLLTLAREERARREDDARREAAQ